MMLEWVAIDEKVWKTEENGCKENLIAHLHRAGIRVCAWSAGAQMHRSEAYAGVSLQRIRDVEDVACGVVIVADSTLYQLAVDFQIPVIWYWRDNEIPQGAKYVLQDMAGSDAEYLQLVHHRYHGMPVTIARGKDWILREIEMQDEPALATCYQSYPEAFAQNILTGREADRESLQAYVENMYEFYGFGMWLAVREGTGEVMGYAGLERIEEDEVEAGSALAGMMEQYYCLQIGYLVLPHFRRQGYAYAWVRAVITYAMEQMQAGRIVALIQKGNEASVGLARRLGFRYLEDTHYRGNEVQVYVYVYESDFVGLEKI